VSFAAITLCVASQRVFVVVVIVVAYFVIDPVRKLSDTPSYDVAYFRPLSSRHGTLLTNDRVIFGDTLPYTARLPFCKPNVCELHIFMFFFTA
jgi:hypothetical protein